ncbi:Lachesin [Folsomia candida]|uniref:Lachesin n=2 Tax=Folsomia candida TaxID=158441 RepID=A0A226F2T4_FOLCA|nr:Lachesin [Folsomia candida]
MILTIHRHIVTKIPRFSVSYDSHKTWLLNINAVQQEDRGYYMCQINSEPMQSQVGYLQVVVPPNILDDDSSDSHVAVREHQNITLSCKAEGFPEPRITWKREDGAAFAVDRRKKVNVSEGERLHLFKISRLEMGAYLCIASNGVPPSISKRITVDVEFSPMTYIPNQLIGAPKSTNVTLECHTEAFPRAISYWVYDNMMILTTGKYNTEIVESSYRTHMRLTVRGLKDKDFGKYRCLSKNSLGETEGSIRLYEIPMPSVPPKATEVKQEKNNAVGVVRLNPISKTDEKWNKGGKGERDRESKSSNRVPSDSSGSNSPNGFNRTSIRVPTVESANSATDRAGSLLQLSLAKCVAYILPATYLIAMTLMGRFSVLLQL